MSTTYVYQDLPGPSYIRVLALYPAPNHDDPLECDLVLHDRESIVTSSWPDPLYDAISYAWGEPLFTHSILSRATSTKLMITARVDSMLRHLRKKGVPRRLWLDAICLNQDNNIEKSIQVSLMGNIYYQARKVHVWLGEAENYTAEIFSLLRYMGALDWEKNEKPFFPVRSVIKSRPDCPPELLLAFPAAKFNQFLRNSWFQRRWVIQEVALGHDICVHSGYNKIDWSWFKAGTDALYALSDDLRLDDKSQLSLQTVMAMHTSNSNIFELMLNIHHTECLNPSDRFYALLPAVERESVEVRIDYTRPWTDLYQDMACKLLNGSQYEELITHIAAFGGLSEVDESLPSWVPNWSRKRKAIPSYAHPRIPLFIAPRNRIDRALVFSTVDAPILPCYIWGAWPSGKDFMTVREYLGAAFETTPIDSFSPRSDASGFDKCIIMRKFLVSELEDLLEIQLSYRGLIHEDLLGENQSETWTLMRDCLIEGALGLAIPFPNEYGPHVWRGYWNMFRKKLKGGNRWKQLAGSAKTTIDLNPPDELCHAVRLLKVNEDGDDLVILEYIVSNSLTLLKDLGVVMSKKSVFFSQSPDAGLWVGPANMQNNYVHLKIDSRQGFVLQPFATADSGRSHPIPTVKSSIKSYRIISVCYEISDNFLSMIKSWEVARYKPFEIGYKHGAYENEEYAII